MIDIIAIKAFFDYITGTLLLWLILSILLVAVMLVAWFNKKAIGKNISIKFNLIKRLFSFNLKDINFGTINQFFGTTRSVKDRIEEARNLLNIDNVSARTKLVDILNEIKDKPEYKKELTSVYNNIGVSYASTKNQGNIDEAISYFNRALTVDPDFIKAKTNLFSVCINSDQKEFIDKALNIAKGLWAENKTEDNLERLALATFSSEGLSKMQELISNLEEPYKALVEKSEGLLRLLAGIYLTVEDTKSILHYCEKGLKLNPGNLWLMSYKAKALLINTRNINKERTDDEVMPSFINTEQTDEIINLFKEIRTKAEGTKDNNLLIDTKYALAHALILLRRFKEVNIQDLIDLQNENNLKEESSKNVNVLLFMFYMHKKDFDTAYSTLVEHDYYKSLDKTELRRIGRIFIFNGSPEHAKLLFNEVEDKAKLTKDYYYYYDLSALHILLGEQPQAISAANTAVEYSKNANEDIKQEALRNKMAVSRRYSVEEVAHDNERSRFIEDTMEYQKKYPSEFTVIKSTNDEGDGLSNEVKEFLSKKIEAWENIKKEFLSNKHYPIYLLEKAYCCSFVELMTTLRTDPSFIFEYNDPIGEYANALKNIFNTSSGFIFDYSSLLDLSKMGYLPYLEKINKPKYLHEKLFEKIQNELLSNEVLELRKLWNYVRSSKYIELAKRQYPEGLDVKNIEKFIDEWILETIKYAKKNNLTVVTNDLRLLNLLKIEKVHAVNTSHFIDYWRNFDYIDDRSYARSLGDLAERFYVYIEFTGTELFQIVAEDNGKIEKRSFHLANQVLLPYARTAKFCESFLLFIQQYWKTQYEFENKVKWLKLLTEMLLQKKQTIDKSDLIKHVEKTLEDMWASCFTNTSGSERETLEKEINKLFESYDEKEFGERIKQSFKQTTNEY